MSTNKQAEQAAYDDLWKKHPVLNKRKLTMAKSDEGYRCEWIEIHKREKAKLENVNIDTEKTKKAGDSKLPCGKNIFSNDVFVNLRFLYFDPKSGTSKPLPPGVTIEAWDKGVFSDAKLSTIRIGVDGKARVPIQGQGENLYFKLQFTSDKNYLNVEDGLFDKNPPATKEFIKLPKNWWSFDRKTGDGQNGFKESYTGPGDAETDPYHDFQIERSRDYVHINYWNDVSEIEKDIPPGLALKLMRNNTFSDSILAESRVSDSGLAYLPIIEANEEKYEKLDGEAYLMSEKLPKFINFNQHKYESVPHATERTLPLPDSWSTKPRKDSLKKLSSTGLGTSSAAPLKIAFEAVRIFTRLEYDNLLKRATPSSSPTPYHLPIDNKIKISVMNSNSTFETTGMIADTFRNDFSDTELLSGHAGIGGSGIATGGGRLYIAVYDADAYNADIYLKIKFATPAYMPLKPKVDYASADFTVSFVDMEKQLLLADEWFSKNQLDSLGKIGVYEDHKNPVLGSPSTPILFKNGVKVTVIVKLPLSTATDKIEGKGLGGHTGIAIRDNFYDYGPLGSALSSPGEPWWDKAAKIHFGLGSTDDVTLDIIKRFLTATIRTRQNIYFVTFFVTEAEASAIGQPGCAQLAGARDESGHRRPPLYPARCRTRIPERTARRRRECRLRFRLARSWPQPATGHATPTARQERLRPRKLCNASRGRAFVPPGGEDHQQTTTCTWTRQYEKKIGPPVDWRAALTILPPSAQGLMRGGCLSSRTVTLPVVPAAITEVPPVGVVNV